MTLNGNCHPCGASQMRIDGVVTCVGPIYAATLARTLPVWLETLDSVTVVRNDDRDKTLFSSRYNVATCTSTRCVQRTVWTDTFTRNGEYFNKGRALNEGITAASPTDWILSFDADTLPPKDWRTIAEPIIQPGNLYGARRNYKKRPFLPYGYFQLWHAQDPLAAPFPEHYPHAGGYDAEFLEHWPADKRIELPFRLKDLEPRRHWFGPGNDHLMQPLLRGGARAYRERGRKLPA